jgi:hypothetical protein
VHAVCAGGERHVDAPIDQQPDLVPATYLAQFDGQLHQRAATEVLFAQLDGDWRLRNQFGGGLQCGFDDGNESAVAGQFAVGY